MSDASDKKVGSVRSVFRVYGSYIWRYQRSFSFLVISNIGLQVVALIVPLFLRQFFNVLAGNAPSVQTEHQLLIIVGFLALTWVIEWVINRIEYIAEMYFVVGIASELVTAGFEYLLGHSYQFFTSNFAGSLTVKVNKFSRAFETLVIAILTDFFPTFLFVIGAIVILYVHNHMLGSILGIWAVFFTAFQLYVAHLRQPSRVEASEADTRVTAALADSISNHSSIVLFSGEVSESQRLRTVVDVRRAAVMRIWNVDNYIWAVFGIFTVFINVVLLYGATIYWTRGELTIGDFVLIQSYLLSTFIRLVSINRTFRRFYDALADAQEMVAILDEPHGVQDSSTAKPLQVLSGEIAFRDVTFSFNTERPVLDAFNLTIKAAEKTALVGPSGAGKSTITKLLLRLYDVTAGSIEIDNQDIKTVTQESLRTAIAFVPQEPILFHRTLMENIRFSRKDATDEEVIDAAKKAHCHEFIQNLPLKYETYVGERGVKLSGGERQRVAIARAILKNAPILMLDEATSSLDSSSELLIQDALATLMRGKTVIVIAHRLSTIMKMDRIIVLDKGAVVEEGTHRELLKKSGLYAELWNHQAGGFLQDE